MQCFATVYVDGWEGAVGGIGEWDNENFRGGKRICLYIGSLYWKNVN